MFRFCFAVLMVLQLGIPLFAQRPIDDVNVLYTFQEGRGATINDMTASRNPLDLTIALEKPAMGPAIQPWLSPYGISLGNYIEAASATTIESALSPCIESNEISVELWLSVATPIAYPILTIGPSAVGARAQPMDMFSVALTKGGELSYSIAGFVAGAGTRQNNNVDNTFHYNLPSSNSPLHAVFAKDSAGNISFYVNGQRWHDSMRGNLSNWITSTTLVLGNKTNMSSQVSRKAYVNVYSIAIYHRALTAAEVSLNYAKGPAMTPVQFLKTTGGKMFDSLSHIDMNASSIHHAATVQADSVVGENISVKNTVAAAKFIGDGSGLTNLPTAGGITGPAGPKGDKGDQGLPGAAGSDGLQGPVGPEGPIGPQGVAGADGRGITWRGAWSADSSYLANDAVHFGTSSYIAARPSAGINPTGKGSVVMAPGALDTNSIVPDTVKYWTLLAAGGDKGEKGDPGIAGLQGAQGEKGEKGVKGDNGDDGPQGLQGMAGAAGPQGEKGDKGDPGYAVGGVNPGDMQYWDGTKWVVVPVGMPGQFLGLTADKTPAWLCPFVIDVDGNVYHTIKIGNQEWMVENLKTTRYNDGTPIPLVTDSMAWASLNSPGYCWYRNNAAAYKYSYGALYNWNVVNTGKLAPVGWHIPSDSEWNTLVTYCGGHYVAGEELKEAGTTHWSAPNVANNATGFTALPGGARYVDPYGQGGIFTFPGWYGYWWTSTEYYPSASTRYAMGNNSNQVLPIADDKKSGYSVRCIRDK
jgi:uncharacterized protein (TIGR02145 family)